MKRHTSIANRWDDRRHRQVEGERVHHVIDVHLIDKALPRCQMSLLSRRLSTHRSPKVLRNARNFILITLGRLIFALLVMCIFDK